MKAVGIISIIYGTLGILYGLASLIMVSFTVNFLGFMPEYDAYMQGFDMEAYMWAIQGMMKIIMPLMIVVGGIYLWGGIVAVKKLAAVFHLRLAAILNIAWYCLYIYMFVTRVMPSLDSFFYGYGFSEMMNMVMIVALVFGGIFYCGYPIFLLIWLKKERNY